MDRFHGLERAYGTYDLKRAKKKQRIGEKIVGSVKTIQKEITPRLWKDHLEGRTGIGIVPIRDDSTCFFGAIDIDVYKGLDVLSLFQQIDKEDMPLVPFRTKSGGIHLFCFVTEAVPASLMREKLEEFAAVLGHGGSEIFPKQDEILSERGDIGQWINMPYFDGNNTNRYAFNINGERVSLNDSLKLIDSKRMSPKEFESYTTNTADSIEDGPPCLQYLCARKFSSGTRNDGLFMLAVYLRKKSETTWEVNLDDYNAKYMDPPLSSSEVSGVVKSVSRKDYGFTCNRPPFKTHCNNPLCRTREFGIGQINGFLQMTSLTKYDSQPPTWFVDVDGGGRLELTTSELQQQGRFQKRCMEALNMMPPVMKITEWQKLIQMLMESVIVIEAPADASPKGLLFEYLERFCTSRANARNKEEILLGKPWTDEGFHYFRIADFMAYLERHRFKDFKVNQICSMIREAGGDHSVKKLKGKTVNVWKISEYAQQTEGFDTPAFEEEHF